MREWVNGREGMENSKCMHCIKVTLTNLYGYFSCILALSTPGMCIYRMFRIFPK